MANTQKFAALMFPVKWWDARVHMLLVGRQNLTDVEENKTTCVFAGSVAEQFYLKEK